MKITIPEKNYNLTEFYHAVAKEMGYADTSELHYDCTKIDIAENIQNGFYDYYTKEMHPAADTVSVTMLLAMSGPKVNRDLKVNEVEVFEGFICNG